MKRPEKVTAEVQCALMEGTMFDFRRSFMGTNVLLEQIRVRDILQPTTKIGESRDRILFRFAYLLH